ncbi:Protein translocase subunit [Frankliniella fusca]|uniref:Protein translocase subunit n=1 Tax=Frankliniella fusca TaxID=407009 RepID=A0AAE1HMP5_9NEOP|nr:Protein translocase subunit [Frankliniella fusca]
MIKREKGKKAPNKPAKQAAAAVTATEERKEQFTLVLYKADNTKGVVLTKSIQKKHRSKGCETKAPNPVDWAVKDDKSKYECYVIDFGNDIDYLYNKKLLTSGEVNPDCLSEELIAKKKEIRDVCKTQEERKRANLEKLEAENSNREHIFLRNRNNTSGQNNRQVLVPLDDAAENFTGSEFQPMPNVNNNPLEVSCSKPTSSEANNGIACDVGNTENPSATLTEESSKATNKKDIIESKSLSQNQTLLEANEILSQIETATSTDSQILIPLDDAAENFTGSEFQPMPNVNNNPLEVSCSKPTSSEANNGIACDVGNTEKPSATPSEGSPKAINENTESKSQPQGNEM